MVTKWLQFGYKNYQIMTKIKHAPLVAASAASGATKFGPWVKKNRANRSRFWIARAILKNEKGKGLWHIRTKAQKEEEKERRNKERMLSFLIGKPFQIFIFEISSLTLIIVYHRISFLSSVF